MNFDFSEEQKLLRENVRAFLAKEAPLTLCRQVLETDSSYSTNLWQAVAQQGWLGTAIPEVYGGAGFGRLELAVIAEELGRVLAPIPFGPSVYLAAEALLVAGTEEQKQQYLPRLSRGEAIATLAHFDAAGDAGERSVKTAVRAGKLSGSKTAVPDGDVADFALVTAKSGRDVGLAIVDLHSSGVRRQHVQSIDPSRSVATLEFERAPMEWLGGRPCGWETIGHVFDRAAVLYAFEQLGGAQRAFEITREYTLNRYAFGRPIASFQALKHRLADWYVELELTRSNCYYGAWALSNEAPELAVAACGARVSATATFELASKEMIQMHGGMGFTWEHDAHLFYRRARYLAAILGPAPVWRERLVSCLEAREQAS
ncbi:MAG: acyl-CoA/acyl-ACP dehydrogenase [Candidatus Binatia bacterium]|nr:acyl-CoA/acyl-ACP dehydrogenase [Candidatus Binatia bacterium]